MNSQAHRPGLRGSRIAARGAVGSVDEVGRVRLAPAVSWGLSRGHRIASAIRRMSSTLDHWPPRPPRAARAGLTQIEYRSTRFNDC